MKRRHLPWLGLVLLVLAGAWLLRAGLSGASLQDDPVATTPSDQASTASPAATSQAETKVTSPSVPDEALPDESLPLPQRLAELDRLARDGHPEASCQLLVERLRCESLRRWKPEPGAGRRERRLEAEGQLALANQLAAETLLQLEQKKACASAPRMAPVDPLTLLGPAAAAGHAPSALLYFELGHEFRNERGIFARPGFDAWRRDAARHLHAAFEAGHSGAALALGRAYLDDGTFANGLVPDDPRRAYLYLQLAGHLSGDPTRLADDFNMGLGADERARIQAEARRLHDERFGGGRFDRVDYSARGPFRNPGRSAFDFCTLPPPL
ncbi:hypothetical protein [Arenimonas sp.]|uniref:hypothetical protein n=1 Tax=Arenimonas sp. TaxID=1872635 RepID=UPI0035B13B76